MGWKPDFHAIVQAHAGQVLDWSQDYYLNQNKMLDPKGVCASCSLIWLKCQRKGASFSNAMRGTAGRQEMLYIARLVRTEFELQVLPGSAEPELEMCYAKAYLADVPMRQLYDRRVFVMTDGEPELSMKQLTKLVTEPGYYFISLQGTGGHSVALNSHLNRFFDPNVGAAVFRQRADMVNAFAQWLRTEYPHLNTLACVEKYQ